MSRIDRKYIEKLRQLQEESDTEYAHQMADLVLTDMLTELEYTEVVDEFNKVKKYYS